MDISSIAMESDVPKPMPVRHPVTGELVLHDDKRPFTISLYGKDSDQVRQVRFKIQDRYRRLASPPPMSTVAADVVEVMVAATADWDIILNGKAPECSPQIVRETFASQPWLLDQATEWVDDRRNYIKG